MRIRWLSGCAIVAVLLSVPLLAFGQSALPWIFHVGATSVATGGEMPAEYFSTIVVQIEGAFVADIEFQKKTKDAAGYVSVQCTNANDLSRSTMATEPGYWECPGGAYRFRANITSYTSGTIVVTGNGTTAVSSRGSGGGGTDGWPLTLSSAASTSEATSEDLSIRGKGAQATNGADLFQSSSGSFEWVCVVAGVRNACDYVRQLAAGKYLDVRNSAGGSIFRVNESTGRITNVTIDCEDTGNNCIFNSHLCGGDVVGVDPVSGQAGHIYERSALDTVTTATAVVGTNQTYGVARFPDVDGNYGILLKCTLPPAWTGVINVIAWGKTTGTGNFRMQLATICYSSNEAPDAAFNTATPYTLPAGTSGRLVRYFLTNPGMTGCASDEVLFVRVFRNRTEGLDTLDSTFDLARIEVWGRNTY